MGSNIFSGVKGVLGGRYLGLRVRGAALVSRSLMLVTTVWGYLGSLPFLLLGFVFRQVFPDRCLIVMVDNNNQGFSQSDPELTR